MAIDKELYRPAQELYRQWNMAKLRQRAAGKLSSIEAFRRYARLVEFIRQLCPNPPVHQRQEEIEAWWRTHRKTA